MDAGFGGVLILIGGQFSRHADIVDVFLEHQPEEPAGVPEFQASILTACLSNKGNSSTIWVAEEVLALEYGETEGL